MTVSTSHGEIARQRAGRWLVEGHQGQYSTYKHTIGAEPQQSSNSIAGTARAATRIHEEQ